MLCSAEVNVLCLASGYCAVTTGVFYDITMTPGCVDSLTSTAKMPHSSLILFLFFSILLLKVTFNVELVAILASNLHVSVKDGRIQDSCM